MATNYDDLSDGIGRGTVRRPRPPQESAKEEYFNRWIKDDLTNMPGETSGLDKLLKTLKGRGKGNAKINKNNMQCKTMDTEAPEGWFDDAIETPSANVSTEDSADIKQQTLNLKLIPSGMSLSSLRKNCQPKQSVIRSQSSDRELKHHNTSRLRRSMENINNESSAKLFNLKTKNETSNIQIKDNGASANTSASGVNTNMNNASVNSATSGRDKVTGKTNISDSSTDEPEFVRKPKKSRAAIIKELLQKKAASRRCVTDDESDLESEKGSGSKDWSSAKCTSDGESAVIMKSLKSTSSGQESDNVSRQESPSLVKCLAANKGDDWSTADNIPTFSKNNKSGHVTIGCPCQDCLYWNIRDFNSIKEEFEEKRKTKTVKPYLLLKEEGIDSKDAVVIKNMTTVLNALPDSKRSVAPKILVHGPMIPYPQKELKEVPFTRPIHAALHMLKYKVAKPIQSYAWLAIMKKMHVCLVHSSETGKTMSYLPAICSFLLNVERHASLPKLNGPISIILCPDASTVEAVLELMNTLLKNVSSNQKIRISVGLRPLDKIIIDQFSKPTDILITTPPTLIYLLKNNKFNMKRLCYLVVEDADKILAKYADEFETILGVTQTMLKHRNCANDVQLICTAETWTHNLEALMKRLKSTPLVAIGNHLEAAALYSRSEMKIIEVEEHLRAEKLYNVLKDIYKVHKPIVICNTAEEVAEITTIFQLYGIRMINVDESMSIEEIAEAHRTWIHTLTGDHIVLVSTDEVFNTHFNITNASLLVNYSLPNSWGIFTKRFGFLMDSYKSPLAANDIRPNCKIVTFVNDKSMEKFQRIGYFFEKNGGQLPEEFQQFLEDTKTREEIGKIADKVDICRRIITFGECKEIRCPGRHKFCPTLDINKHFTNAFTLTKYQILKIVKPNLYIIKPLQYTDFDDVVHEAYDPKEQIEKLLYKRRCLELARDVHVNGRYILVQDNTNIYYRCFVRNIAKRNATSDAPETVEVESIDTYFIRKVNASELYEMTAELKKIPPACCKLYIANMVPPERDESWSHHAKRFLTKSFEALDYNNSDTFYSSTLRLQLGNIFWADDLYMQVQVEDVEPLNKLKLKKFITSHRMGDLVEGPITKLYELCKKENVNLPNYDKILERRPKIKSLQQAVPQWAHLMEDGYNAIYFSNAVDPDRMFVRLSKFHDLLLDLQKSIQKAIKVPHYRTLKPSQVEIGKCYLALDPDGEDYCRVLVTNIESDIADCFYGDYGDSKLVPISELKYITDNLITKLPFQAIECKLYGVQPVLEQWTDEATDILYNYCFEENSDFFRTLYTTKLKLEPGVYSKNHKYSILLLDYSADNPLVINNLLIDSGFAAPVENEDLSINFNLPPTMTVPRRDDSDEDDYLSLVPSNGKNVEPMEFNEADFDVVIDDAEQLLNQVLEKCYDDIKQLVGEAKAESATNNNNSKNYDQSRLHPIVVAPPSDTLTDVLTPEVLWYQTEKAVVVEIKLIGVTDYDIKILLGRAISFSTNLNGRKYALKCQLFESVTKEFQHTAHGQVVKVTLNKVKELEWPRLVLSKDVHRNIKYNLERCIIPDDEDNGEFLNLGPDKEEEILPDDVSLVDIESDIDYSDSDLEVSDSD